MQHRDSSNWPLDDLGKHQRFNKLRLSNVPKPDIITSRQSPTRTDRSIKQSVSALKSTQDRNHSRIRTNSQESINQRSQSPVNRDAIAFTTSVSTRTGNVTHATASPVKR